MKNPNAKYYQIPNKSQFPNPKNREEERGINQNLDYNYKYIIVSPAKNEEENLPDLIQSMKKQTIKPVLWVITDDGCTDNTPEIIREAQEKYDWIKSIRLEEYPRDIHIHYVHVFNKGVEFAIEYCKMHDIQYEYIGVLDADMVIEPAFFEKLIKEFEKDTKLGVASGSLYTKINNKLILEKTREDVLIGSAKLWRKGCYEEIKGLPVSYSPDVVADVLAKLRGWETRMFKHIKAIQTRGTNSAEGLWNGYKMNGISAYFRNYHPVFVLAKGLKYLFERPCYTGIAYLYGYFGSFIRRMEKIDNKEVRDYYWHNKHKEAIQYYKNKLIKKFRTTRFHEINTTLFLFRKKKTCAKRKTKKVL